MASHMHACLPAHVPGLDRGQRRDGHVVVRVAHGCYPRRTAAAARSCCCSCCCSALRACVFLCIGLVAWGRGVGSVQQEADDDDDRRRRPLLHGGHPPAPATPALRRSTPGCVQPPKPRRPAAGGSVGRSCVQQRRSRQSPSSLTEQQATTDTATTRAHDAPACERAPRGCVDRSMHGSRAPTTPRVNHSRIGRLQGARVGRD